MLSKLSFFTLIIVAYFSFVIARSLFASTLGLWQSTSSLVELHGYTAAVTVGGYVYVIGGEDCTLNCIRNTVERAKINLDGSLSSWQIESPMIKRRVGHTAVAFNNYIYVLSGQFDGTVPGSVERAQVNPDGSLESWQLLDSMATTRTSHVSVVANDYIYAIGGVTSPHSGPGEYLKNVERAKINPDGSLGVWEILTSEMNTTRINPSAVVVGNYIYVLGGPLNSSFANSVERTQINPDGTLGTWELMSPMISDRFDAATVVADDYIYALGGSTEVGNTNSVERAQINPDGSLSLWGFVSSMLEVRFAHAAIQHDENLYALGGNGFAGSDLRTTERATQPTPTPTPSPSPLPSPSPTPSPSPFPSPTSTPTITVNIDIKPGSYPNSINPKSNGKIPVAILSTNSFNATTQINRTSLIFGRTGDEPSLAFCGKTGEDVNADGLLDLVCHFTTQLTGFQNGNALGKLKGKTVGGIPISGDDSVRLVI